MKNISETCLKIDNILKKQNIPVATYNKLNELLCDIIKTNTENMDQINSVLKQTYLDISNNYDVSDLSHKTDIVSCVASAFRDKASKELGLYKSANRPEMITLSFTDEIGYSEFKVSKSWLEKQETRDSEQLYHLASANPEESNFVS